MNILEKLLGLLTAGGAIAGAASVSRRFLSSLAQIIALSVVGAIVAGGMVIACLCETYALFTRHGIDPDTAFLYTAGIGVLVLLAIAGLIALRIRGLGDQTIRFSHSGLLSEIADSPVGSVVSAFVSGYKSGTTAERRTK